MVAAELVLLVGHLRRIRLPAGAKTLFLPQRPYMPIGTWTRTRTGRRRCRLASSNGSAIARALLIKPDWLFLDEATSATDEEEASLYRMVANALTATTVISIGARSRPITAG